MMMVHRFSLYRRGRLLLVACLALAAAPAAAAQVPAQQQPSQETGDGSVHKQHGIASYYAHRFTGRKMANGRRFRPDSNVAASRTLPLGTVARVTNTQTGKSATVRVEDRGPYVDGRVVDVTPKTAEQLGMKQAGVAPVEVEPLAVPGDRK
jgi:rare lipoprotein A